LVGSRDLEAGGSCGPTRVHDDESDRRPRIEIVEKLLSFCVVLRTFPKNS